MPLTPEVWLPEFTANTVTSDAQTDNNIIQLNNGNILVTWTSTATTGAAFPAGTDVIGQLFDPFGNTIGGEFRVNNTRNSHDERDASIAATTQGGFIAAYVDFESGATNDYRIQLDEFNSDASHQSGLQIELSGNVRSDPQVAVLSSTSALVAWREDAANDSIHFRIYNPSTNTVGTDRTLFSNGAGSGPLSELSATALSSGNYVVAARASFPGTEDEIWFELINASGGQFNFTRIPTTSGNGDDDRDPSVTALTGGGFVISWQNTDSNDTDLQFQIYNALGSPIGSTTTVNSSGVSDNKNESEVVALSDGGFIVFYDDDQTGVNDVSGQRYNSSGAKVGSEFIVDVSGGNNPKAVLLDDGRVAVTWGSNEVKMAILDTRDAANTTLGSSDVQVGTIGGDTVGGAAGADVINTWDGNDFLTESTVSGATDHFLGDGNDNMVVRSSIGSDGFDGGDGIDAISWSGSSQVGGTFNMAAGTASNGFATEVMANFETLFATDGNDTVIGTSGANRILTYDGNDSIDGGNGNDTLLSGDDNDTVDGGGGSDVINGGDGDDSLNGGTSADSLIGGNGNDTLNAGSSNGDTLTAGNNDDLLIIGGTGTFTLAGGNGNDTVQIVNPANISSTGRVFDLDLGISTNNGTSFVGTWSGLENIIGMADVRGRFVGNGEDNQITASSQDDTLEGGAGDDTLNGLDGNDSLVGGSGGGDVLNGGLGDDTLVGFGQQSQIGNGQVNGGDGNDLITGNINNYFADINGGADNDTLDASAWISSSVPLEFDLRNQELTLSNFVGDTVTDLISIENVIGTDFADVIRNANAAGNSIKAGDGNDTVYAGSSTGAAETLDGGDGTDTLNTSSFGGGGYTINLAAGTTSAGETFVNFENLISGNGSETLIGTDTANSIDAAGGADDVDAGNGNDFVEGGTGNDTISGGAGQDIIRGQDDDDVIRAGADNDRADGGGGNDTINGNGGDDTINGGDGLDSLSGSDGNDIINGGKGDDTLKGFDDNDTLRGDSGEDSLSGGLGADVIEGNNGADYIDGGDGDDSISGGSDNDEIYGRQRNDTINGDDGADMLYGNDGNDLIRGGNGTDSIEGGNDNDTILGGTESDTLRGEAGLDSIEGGSGNDVISGQQNSDYLNGQGGADQISGGTGNDTIFGEDGADTIQGNQNDDSISGGDGDDQITGGGGFDIIRGGVGNDTISGNDGNDTVFGGNDSDTIYGGSGDDELNGGNQSDTFIFENGFGNDVITDFNAANAEKIDFSGFSAINNFGDVMASLSNSGGNALISAGGNSILLDGVAVGDVGAGQAYSADDFIF